MKSKFLLHSKIFVGLLLKLSVSFVYPQTWEEIKMTFPVGDTLKTNTTFYFSTENIGWISSTGVNKNNSQKYVSTFYKTTNGGNNWEEIGNDSVSQATFSIFAIDSLNCWFSNSYGDIKYTKDGGESWLISKVPIFSSETIGKLLFFDSLYGLAVGKDVWRTVDGGKGWDKISVNSTILPKGHFFINKQKGWKVSANSPVATDAGSISQTSDSGVTWVYKPERIGALLHSLFFPSESLGISVGRLPFGGGAIYVTNNNGDTWNYVPPSPPEIFVDIKFINKLDGVIACSNGRIRITKDGSSTWEGVTVSAGVNFTFIQALQANGKYVLAGIDTVWKLFKLKQQSLGIKNNDKFTPINSRINTFPNPFNGNVKIHFKFTYPSHSKNAVIRIFDFIGREVYSDIVTLYGDKEGDIIWNSLNNNRQQLNSGVYIIAISNMYESIFSKIVLIK